jgi:APA family basic amino acid/polyamine antiporter
MGMDSELPRFMAKKLANGAPYVAEILVSLAVVLLVFLGSTLTALGISSFCVLVYYAITNWAGFRQPRQETTRPKYLNRLGFSLCLLLALSVPLSGLIAGAALLLVAMVLRWGLRALR